MKLDLKSNPIKKLLFFCSCFLVHCSCLHWMNWISLWALLLLAVINFLHPIWLFHCSVYILLKQRLQRRTATCSLYTCLIMLYNCCALLSHNTVPKIVMIHCCYCTKCSIFELFYMCSINHLTCIYNLQYSSHLTIHYPVIVVLQLSAPHHYPG